MSRRNYQENWGSVTRVKDDFSPACAHIDFMTLPTSVLSLCISVYGSGENFPTLQTIGKVEKSSFSLLAWKGSKKLA